MERRQVVAIVANTPGSRAKMGTHLYVSIASLLSMQRNSSGLRYVPP